MSDYTVYTKTRHVPVYVLYQCQSCKKMVVDKGSYDVSASFTDGGTWTKRGAEKRAQRAEDSVSSEAEEAMTRFQDKVVPIKSEFQRINCRCPYCHHSSLCKYDKDSINKQKRRFTLIIDGIGILFLIALSIFGGGLNIRDIFLPTVIVTGILSIFGESIIDLYNKYLFNKAYETFCPIISAKKNLLIERARDSLKYKDTDFSRLQDMPNILEMNDK